MQSRHSQFSAIHQWRSEGTSSVALEVLIIGCHIEFINWYIFNCLKSSFCFPKIISFASTRERLFMDARPQFRILKSPGKMMTCYFRDTDAFLRYCTLRKGTLKCRFLTKIIKITWFVLSKVVPQLWGTSV